jgi:inorganic phosphate transporter, PiT family
MSFEHGILLFALVCGFYMAWSIGANDVANAMGTSVGSGALTLRRAVVIAAVLEFSGAYFFGGNVTQTVQKGIINTEMFQGQPQVLVVGMIAALIAAGAWLQLASYFGWPVSTTHSIIGALVGFGAVVGGVEAVHWGSVGSIVLSWIFSPFLGGIISFLLFTLIRRQIFYSPHPLKIARRLMPYLAAFVVFFLVMVVFSKGLKRMNLQIGFLETFLISFAIGALTWLIAKFIQRKFTSPKSEESSEEVASSLSIIDLEKASKYLKKAKKSSSGEAYYKLSSLQSEVESMSAGLLKNRKDMDAQYQDVEKIFSVLQILTAAFMAFAHGANDVANAIGPLAAVVHIVQTGNVVLNSPVPSWILALGGAGITVGLATWGWRVIETVGKRITELTPSRGFAAEFGTVITIVLASKLGLPVSTTHILVGAVLGVGLARGLGALDLSALKDIFISWMVTVPVGALLAIVIYYILRIFI